MQMVLLVGIHKHTYMYSIIGRTRLSRISGMEWWNGTLIWNTGINNLMPNVPLSHYCLMSLNICYVCMDVAR